MKKIALIITFVLFPTIVSLGQSISDAIAKSFDSNRISIEFDFSECKIGNLTVDEFSQWLRENDNNDSITWKNDLKKEFINEFQDKNPSIKVIANSEVKLFVYVTAFFENKDKTRGNMSGLLKIYQNDTFIKDIILFGRGGRIGTELNLMSDGMRSAGTDLGKMWRKRRLKDMVDKRQEIYF